MRLTSARVDSSLRARVPSGCAQTDRRPTRGLSHGVQSQDCRSIVSEPTQLRPVADHADYAHLGPDPAADWRRTRPPATGDVEPRTRGSPDRPRRARNPAPGTDESQTRP